MNRQKCNKILANGFGSLNRQNSRAAAHKLDSAITTEIHGPTTITHLGKFVMPYSVPYKKKVTDNVISTRIY